jgi:hypothetical protein
MNTSRSYRLFLGIMLTIGGAALGFAAHLQIQKVAASGETTYTATWTADQAIAATTYGRALALGVARWQVTGQYMSGSQTSSYSQTWSAGDATAATSLNVPIIPQYGYMCLLSLTGGASFSRKSGGTFITTGNPNEVFCDNITHVAQSLT